MTQMRILNDAGIEHFRQYMNDLRAGLAVVKPKLEEGFSIEYPVKCDLEQTPFFASKLEMAKYLYSKFESAGIKREDVVFNKGLWSWLGYYWFELHAKDKSEKLSPGNDYRYIFSADWKTQYRHFIWLPYDMFSRHKDEESVTLFLSNSISVQGDLTEQLAGRISTYINTQVVKAAALLYLDRETKKAKRGSAGKDDKPGTFRRFIMVLRQAERTFDIYTTSAREIVGLLPHEFDKWRE